MARVGVEGDSVLGDGVVGDIDEVARLDGAAFEGAGVAGC